MQCESSVAPYCLPHVISQPFPSYRSWSHAFPPTFAEHVALNGLPDLLDDLLVSEARGLMSLTSPPIDAGGQHAVSPSTDVIRRCLTTPANVDAERVLEQLIGIAPLVVLELPRLTRREYTHHVVPVLRLELFGTFNEEEAQRPRRVDVGHAALHVEHVGRPGTCVRGCVYAFLKEGARVGETEEGGSGRREEDDGIWSSSRGLLVKGDLSGADGDGLWFSR
jgi:hypothetical protein